jgi:hypothetical protein
VASPLSVVTGSTKGDEEQGKQRAVLEQRLRNGDVVLRGSSSGALRPRQGGSGPLRSSSSAPMVSPRKTRHQWIGKARLRTKEKGKKGHWCVLSPSRQNTEQVMGKTVPRCTVAAAVRCGRRSWKQLQLGIAVPGRRINNSSGRNTAQRWAQRRGCRGGGVSCSATQMAPGRSPWAATREPRPPPPGLPPCLLRPSLLLSSSPPRSGGRQWIWMGRKTRRRRNRGGGRRMGFIGRRPRVPSARAVAGIPWRARPWPRGDIQGGARLVL